MPVVANITSKTVVKASSGKVKFVSVMVAGSAVGTINDALTGNDSASNAYIPCPKSEQCMIFQDDGVVFATGIIVAPGTGQTISIGFE